jgi:hypothetical protein
MKLLVQSAMVFFGTLLAAALIVWGEPANAEVAMIEAAPAYESALVGLLGLDD